jgi:hypothetical protein
VLGVGSVLAAAEFTHPTDSYRVVFPDDWHLSDRGEFLIDNKPGARRQGMGLNPGGAFISIVALPPGTDAVARMDEVAAKTSGEVLHRSTRSDPEPRLELIYTLDPGFAESKLVIRARHVGGRVFWAVWEHRTDDPNARHYAEVFSAVVASIRLKP